MHPPFAVAEEVIVEVRQGIQAPLALPVEAGSDCGFISKQFDERLFRVAKLLLGVGALWFIDPCSQTLQFLD